MPINVACPTCGAKFKTPDNAAGRTVKCPKCAAPITVPVESTPTAELASDPPPPPQANLKPCPFCGESIQAVALKCRHCGETVDVAMRAAEEARRLAEKSSSQPTVFMNAGGGGGASSSSSSSAAAAASGSDWYRQQAMGIVGCLFLGIMMLGCCIIIPSCIASKATIVPASTAAETKKTEK